MATLVPPPSKRQKRELQAPKDLNEIPEDLPHVLIKFQASDSGESIGGSIRVPGSATEKQLETLLNKLIQQANNEEDSETTPYTFSLLKSEAKDDKSLPVLVDIVDNLYTSVLKPGHKTTEDQLTLVYTPRAVFKVRPINRSTSEISGHGSTILAAQFAPFSSSRMVTGAGDHTARIWDCDTQTPYRTLKGHTDWVLAVSWSPDGRYIATGSMDNSVRIWDPKTGKQIGKTLQGHNKWITSLSWEPLHLLKPKSGNGSRLASSSKDGTIRVWDVDRMLPLYTMSGHKSSVTHVKWSGLGDIYSTSQDKTVKVWSSKDGRLITSLNAHAHWVNHIALSTDYSLRTGPFDWKSSGAVSPASKLDPNTTEGYDQLIELARKNFEKQATLNGQVSERVVTASDDFTILLWEPAKSSKPIAKMHGHQKAVNHVAFSPDGRYIASCSFDNSVKLWDGRDGKFIATLRGHVGAVYQCAWSSDCRLLVTCSKDTTLKVWDVRTKKLMSDLPGHKDQVYAVDWSVDGRKVASGGKDKHVRLWSH